MQATTQAPSPDEVDAETLQALLVHFGSAAETFTRSHEAASGAADPAGIASDEAGDGIPEYALPDAQYLERTILPLLLRGLEEVAVARPPDALAFLGAYLISNNPQQPTGGAVGVAAAAINSGGVSSSGGVSPDQAREGSGVGLLPTEQPAIAEAVQRAVERFAPPVKGTTGPAAT